ncbi:MAG TPA: hypothetical protein VGN72_12835 [Tepidisphaeraceae bacterium]|jgi:Ca2+/Na+ antiporter|nr:hypothetical protein [Tepidisphaeraceae bacterium]
MLNAFGGPELVGTLLLIGAAMLIYAVAWSAIDLVTDDAVSPGWLAVGSSLPLAAVAWAGALLGQADFVMAVVLGTSIAGLAIIVGTVLTGPSELELPPSSRAWPLLLPVVLLLLMMGFGARIGLQEAAMLAVLGAAVGAVWRAGDASPTLLTDADVVPVTTARRRLDVLVVLQALLTLLLAVVAGWLAVRGALDLSAARRGLSPGVVGITLISAMLMLPSVGKATFLSQTNRAGIAIGAQVGAVLIALTFILPVAVVVWYVRTVALTDAGAVDPFEMDRVVAMPFAIGFWRVETTVLLALALPLLPVAARRWKPGRTEGLVLICGYVYYLLLITRASNRWH